VTTTKPFHFSPERKNIKEREKKKKIFCKKKHQLLPKTLFKKKRYRKRTGLSLIICVFVCVGLSDERSAVLSAMTCVNSVVRMRGLFYLFLVHGRGPGFLP
jgi:hypothetical protein